MEDLPTIIVASPYARSAYRDVERFKWELTLPSELRNVEKLALVSARIRRLVSSYKSDVILDNMYIQIKSQLGAFKDIIPNVAIEFRELPDTINWSTLGLEAKDFTFGMNEITPDVVFKVELLFSRLIGFIFQHIRNYEFWDKRKLNQNQAVYFTDLAERQFDKTFTYPRRMYDYWRENHPPVPLFPGMKLLLQRYGGTSLVIDPERKKILQNYIHPNMIETYEVPANGLQRWSEQVLTIPMVYPTGTFYKNGVSDKPINFSAPEWTQYWHNPTADNDECLVAKGKDRLSLQFPLYHPYEQLLASVDKTIGWTSKPENLFDVNVDLTIGGQKMTVRFRMIEHRQPGIDDYSIPFDTDDGGTQEPKLPTVLTSLAQSKIDGHRRNLYYFYHPDVTYGRPQPFSSTDEQPNFCEPTKGRTYHHLRVVASDTDEPRKTAFSLRITLETSFDIPTIANLTRTSLRQSVPNRDPRTVSRLFDTELVLYSSVLTRMQVNSELERALFILPLPFPDVYTLPDGTIYETYNLRIDPQSVFFREVVSTGALTQLDFEIRDSQDRVPVLFLESSAIQFLCTIKFQLITKH